MTTTPQSSNKITVSDLPYRLLVQHRSTIGSMLWGGVKSVLPSSKATQNYEALERQGHTPSKELLGYYRRWCGAPDNAEIPPHFLGAATAMPIVSELTSQGPYPLFTVLNQGVRLQMHKPLPEGEAIHLKGEVIDASDDGRRARIQSRVIIGTHSTPEAITLDAIVAVMLKPGAKKSETKPKEEKVYKTLGNWCGAANEGQTFFWLTGDLNPIHTFPAFAKHTRYKGCIMHGYGAFAQIFEHIRHEFGAISDIETRFIRTIPLPSPVFSIQITESPEPDGHYHFRLIDELGTHYQAGHFYV